MGDFTVFSKITVYGKGAYITYRNWQVCYHSYPIWDIVFLALKRDFAPHCYLFWELLIIASKNNEHSHET